MKSTPTLGIYPHRPSRERSRSLKLLIGVDPPTTSSLADAGKYLETLKRTLDRGDLQTEERRALYKQRGKWQRRAAGADPRWAIHGARPGRLSLTPASPLADADRDPATGLSRDDAARLARLERLAGVTRRSR